MSMLPGFYEADKLEQIAINLFHGWGYNFYRLENQLRADDLMVRREVGHLLGAARQSVETAESAYRREVLPPPSRAQPRPDPTAMAGAQQLERLSAAIGAVAGRIAAQPVPENDRMTQRYRTEAATLQRLIACDQRLVGQAEMLRAMVEGQTGSWLIDQAAAVQAGVAALDDTLRERQDLV